MFFTWLATALVPLVVIAVIVWRCYERQRKHEGMRILRAIQSEDEAELRLLLAERTDPHSVTEWFGESALNIAVKSFAMGSDNKAFIGEAIRLLITYGADINEAGIEWKTALMHAAANGNLELCTVLLGHGADPAAHDMFGRTAADWAEAGGHHRIASLLREG